MFLDASGFLSGIGCEGAFLRTLVDLPGAPAVIRPIEDKAAIQSHLRLATCDLKLETCAPMTPRIIELIYRWWADATPDEKEEFREAVWALWEHDSQHLGMLHVDRETALQIADYLVDEAKTGRHSRERTWPKFPATIPRGATFEIAIGEEEAVN